jgi:hypothetical protein
MLGRVYTGARWAGIGIAVTVDRDGVIEKLDPRLDLARHSPAGLDWGYAGSGPAQLALAILADCLGDDELALALHQDFKAGVVARLRRAYWILVEERIRAWVAEATRLTGGDGGCCGTPPTSLISRR